MDINRTLKFSWGHIIAFVAVIFISYVAYMGSFYSNGGDFTAAAIKVFFSDIVLLTTFIGAQILKGTDKKFDRSIIIERILICLCPIVFIYIMIPYNHYWNVYSERTNIEKTFSSSIKKSKTIFSDYNDYAHNRIDNYKEHLTTIVNNKNTNPAQYKDAGFSRYNDVTRKENYITTLKLQLLSQNTSNLQEQALEWIENANQGASVWNAFLIGNIDKISDAITSWNNTLTHLSEFRMSNEPDGYLSKHKYSYIRQFDSDSYRQAVAGLQQLKDKYKINDGVKFDTIWTGILLFFMLLFPYLLQNRNTKTIGLYYLIPLNFNHSKANISKSQKTDTTKQEVANDTAEHVTHINDDIYGGTF